MHGAIRAGGSSDFQTIANHLDGIKERSSTLQVSIASLEAKMKGDPSGSHAWDLNRNGQFSDLEFAQFASDTNTWNPIVSGSGVDVCRQHLSAFIVICICDARSVF